MHMENNRFPEFNLLDKPWIVVRKKDGSQKEVSVLELFRNAPEYMSLAGELPTQDIAILRFLLAILHQALGGADINGNPLPNDEEKQVEGLLELWQALWLEGNFPYKRIEAYLRKYEDRFWLFHPETPFYQVNGMDKGTRYTSAKLNGELAESSNKIRLFPQRSAACKNTLSFGEATRWLIHVNGFDDTAAKPTQKGLPSPGAGWLGKLGLIVAIGDNLFRTLMLNLVLLPDNNKSELWGDEKAIWEKSLCSQERRNISVPNSQAALLTLQSRRLLLKREGNAVTGYLLQGGDFFPKENAWIEQMTIWRNNTKNDTVAPEYVPKRHNPSLQMWRDFSPLIEQGERKKIPGIMAWLKRLQGEGILERGLIRFQIAGMKYGDKDFFVEDLIHDSLSFNAGLLSDLHKKWITHIIDELNVTDSLVREFGTLAQKFSQVSGKKNGPKADDARAICEEAKSRAYYRLDQPFRRWLEEINPNTIVGEKIDKKCEEWWKESRTIVRDMAWEIVRNPSPQALIGRDGETLPGVYNRFLYNTTNRETLRKKKGGETHDKPGKSKKTV